MSGKKVCVCACACVSQRQMRTEYDLTVGRYITSADLQYIKSIITFTLHAHELVERTGGDVAETPSADILEGNLLTEADIFKMWEKISIRVYGGTKPGPRSQNTSHP